VTVDSGRYPVQNKYDSQLTSLQTILHEHFTMTEALCTKITKPLLSNSWTIILVTEFVNCERFNAGFIEMSRLLLSGFMFPESKIIFVGTIVQNLL